MSSDYLLNKQTFLRGIASITNIGGTVLFNESKTPEEADARAISSDWEAVGNDMFGALNEYARSL